MKKILVTGGLGFIGSHTVVELQNKGFKVIIIDDLSNSNIAVLDKITEITGVKPDFHQFDLRVKQNVTTFFENNTVDGIIHFAAFKAVGESVQNPLDYYENNINSLIYLLQEIRNRKLDNFIFSSSCMAYGTPEKLPITENTPSNKAASTYANTKQIGEEIIQESCKAYDFNAITLRYFNPIGAHESAKIGELPNGVPQNLIPYVTQTAAGIRKELAVFGDDYDTPDGTAIRDYIHVVDLAKAHIIALERLLNKKNKQQFELFNIGTGTGSSVLEIINAFEKATQKKLNYKIVKRRAGDIKAIYADTTIANKELNWKTEKTLEEALLSSWKWQENQ
ncbi:UDP-glucose 4-epimerase GalE [Tenacibaculum piscium]|uniref:UDP-glucose 4-epimerase n=1 Tax=Tenacibaculum piscium TaxID=1458515 RepID=A0A2H1YJ13_9FLAO|nr:UDP-glucose 4-epimerase GalE [Tenacibaculum piscium]MBE7628696.1 UDP-glucose 4-epimerase GalE [Tenacibaculum piscium]MBE7669837.1 UDP-glucose 4-epimerase GalE [Tenacibaculum piscium]MBE7684568.1 UDP-glucose 4-epimerase GalE [Tenacibaculum piscium]MBE7689188.1 UDP-glucose 4-epimerase GalE [Tenacibaculum piscium]SOS75485.1 UDP-glucose 4-epimerase [Tenacibaculum piscium]